MHVGTRAWKGGETSRCAGEGGNVRGRVVLILELVSFTTNLMFVQVSTFTFFSAFVRVSESDLLMFSKKTMSTFTRFVEIRSIQFWTRTEGVEVGDGG